MSLCFSKLKPYLLVLLFAVFLSNSVAAQSPALEVLSGDVQLGGNDIVNVTNLTLNNALEDSNVSDALTISASGSVDSGAIDANLTDTKVSDNITIDSAGKVDNASITGNVGNSLLASGAVTSGKIGSDEVGTSPLDLSITPKWTGLHTFSSGLNATGNITDDSTVIWDSSSNVVPSGVVQTSGLDSDTVDGNEASSFLLDDGTDSMSGDLDLGSNDIGNVGSIALTNALGDDNVSNGISYQASGLSSGSFADGDVANNITVNETGEVEKGALSDVGTLSYTWSDSEVSDSITTGSVSGFVNASPKLLSGNISDNAITSAKINSGAVGSSELGNGAVGSDQIATQSINESHVRNGELNNSHLKSEAVNNDSIDMSDTYTLNTLNLKNGLGDSDVSDSITVDGGFLSAGTPLTSGNLSTGSVGTAEVSDNSINSSDIDNGEQFAVNSVNASQMLQLSSTDITTVSCGSSSHVGEIRRNQSQDGLYYCNGTDWQRLDQ